MDFPGHLTRSCGFSKGAPAGKRGTRRSCNRSGQRCGSTGTKRERWPRTSSACGRQGSHPIGPVHDLPADAAGYGYCADFVKVYLGLAHAPVCSRANGHSPSMASAARPHLRRGVRPPAHALDLRRRVQQFHAIDTAVATRFPRWTSATSRQASAKVFAMRPNGRGARDSFMTLKHSTIIDAARRNGICGGATRCSPFMPIHS